MDHYVILDFLTDLSGVVYTWPDFIVLVIFLLVTVGMLAWLIIT